MEKAAVLGLKKDIRDVFIYDGIAEEGHKHQEPESRHHYLLNFLYVLVLFIAVDLKHFSKRPVLRNDVIDLFVHRKISNLGLRVPFYN